MLPHKHKARSANLWVSFADLALNRWLAYLPTVMPAYQKRAAFVFAARGVRPYFVKVPVLSICVAVSTEVVQKCDASVCIVLSEPIILYLWLFN